MPIKSSDPLHEMIESGSVPTPPAYHPPAYPSLSFSQNNNTGEGISHHSEGGMTLRDYFAAHAPVKAPSWFHHKAPFEVPPLLSFKDALLLVPGAAELPIERRNSIINWSSDPIYEMEDTTLQAMGRAAFILLDESRDKRLAVMEANDAATWFAWRWHYATTMLRVRDEL